MVGGLSCYFFVGILSIRNSANLKNNERRKIKGIPKSPKISRIPKILSVSSVVIDSCDCEMKNLPRQNINKIIIQTILPNK